MRHLLLALFAFWYVGDGIESARIIEAPCLPECAEITQHCALVARWNENRIGVVYRIQVDDDCNPSCPVEDPRL